MFPEFELLDLFGPLEIFGMHEKQFRIKLIAETAGPIASQQGPRSVVDTVISDNPPFDILLIPGEPEHGRRSITTFSCNGCEQLPTDRSLS
ncbi:hypothetical protein [Pararhizobium sp. IMCC21322]|uniref:hypothetical protein n=1 Tax=Pararhizobium sp. IMCC21322 TaxID=3067903 RepID=UPI0035319258